MIPCFTTLEPVTLPLASDPALQRQAGSAGPIGRYMETSDPGDLSALDLDDVTRITIRALSESEMLAAKRDPGAMPKAGHRAALDARPWAELDDDERVALDAYVEWERSYRMAHIVAALVSLDGYEGPQALTAIDSISPDGLRAAVVLEVYSHILRMSTLGPAGKAPSKRASGKGQPPAGLPDGTAPPATAAGEG